VRFITIIAALILMSNSNLLAADLKIGHFDLQRMLAQSDAGKESREKYLARVNTYQDEMNRRAEKLKELKNSIEGEAKKLKENERPSNQLVEKDKEYAALFREFQRLQGGYQDELKLYDNELTRKVLEELTPVVGEFAVANHYDYLFKSLEPFAYASETRDLTDELVRIFNKAHRK